MSHNVGGVVLSEFIRKTPLSYSFFRITPHVTTLNSASRKIATSLYELLSYRDSNYMWFKEKGYRKTGKTSIEYIDKPKLLWHIIMNTEKVDPSVSVPNAKGYKTTIEYVVGIPSHFKESFKVKFSSHEQWKRCTLEELDHYVNPVIASEDNLDVYAITTTRHAMFSFEFDYSQQSTPISDVLAVSRELTSGEGLTVMFSCDAVSRRKWKGYSDYAWTQWTKGYLPTKPGLDWRNVSTDVISALVKVSNDVLSLVNDIMSGIRKMFFNDTEKVDKVEIPQNINSERAALLVNGDLSKRTKNKRNLPVFNTDCVLAVRSEDRVKRDVLTRSVLNAYNALKGDNELKAVKVNIKPSESSMTVKGINSTSFYLSTDELGKMVMQLPTADIQKDFKDELKSNQRTEIVIDKELKKDTGIFAGYVTDRGTKHGIHIQRDNLDLSSTARVIVGSPRMGKDQAAINLVVEAKRKHNMGAIVIDVINERNGHRGMSDAIRDHLDPEDIIDLDLTDTENPIYLGLEPIIKLIPDSRIASDRIADELCAFLLQDGDEDKLQTADHLREASKLTNGDVLAIKHVFTSKSYRNKLVEAKKELFDMTIWEMYDNMSDSKQQAIYTPVMRRLGQILNSEFLKPMFCQVPNKNLDLFKEISEGKVIMFRMKTGIMSSRVVNTLCHWIVLVCFLIKLAQDGLSRGNGGTLLVLNEPVQYLTSSLVDFFERILTEGPKYKIVPVFIFHAFKQFHKHSSFVEILKSSSVNWHLFRNTNEDVYKQLFPYLSKTFESPQHAFEATKAYQYIGVWLNSSGAYYDPFVADAPDMIHKRYATLDNSNLTLEHSKRYGRPIKEVLDEIKTRNKEALG